MPFCGLVVAVVHKCRHHLFWFLWVLINGGAMFADMVGQEAGNIISHLSEGFLYLSDEGPISALVYAVVGLLTAIAVIWTSFIAWRKFKESASKV